MRLSHIHDHIEQQFILFEIIVHAYGNFTKDGLTNLISQRIHARLSILKDDWEQFSLEHKAIMIAINELCTNDKLNIHNHSYFTNNLFAITHEHYAE